MALVWSEDYATSIDSIDRQHRKLFEYVNKIENCVKRNVFEGEVINSILDFLEQYTKMHFTHEEFCMKEINCPSAERNKKAHDNFLELYTDFVNQYKASSVPKEKEELIRKLQRTAENWLVSHICKIDLHMKACAKS